MNSPPTIDWIQAFLVGWFVVISGVFAAAMLASLVLDIFLKRENNQTTTTTTTTTTTATKTPGLPVSRKERAILEDTGRSGVFVGRLPVINTLCGKGLLRPLNQEDTFELTEHGAWILKQISSGQTRRPGI